MTKKNLSASGVVTYWTTSETNLDKLRAACIKVDAGLEKLIPEASTLMNALRQALEAVYPGKLIRKLDGEGFAAVLEEKGKTCNDYVTAASAWFDGDNIVTTAGMEASGEAAKVRAAYKGHRGILQPVQVGTLLSRVVGEYLGGTMLRPKTGGVYWLPQDRAAKWEAVGKAIESAALVSGSSAVYMIHHEMDEQAIKAVRDAIVHEVSGEAERINAEIMSGELGAKALKTRESEAIALIAKLKRYEKLLDTTLTSARKSLGDVKDAAAAAALLALSQAEETPAAKSAA